MNSATAMSADRRPVAAVASLGAALTVVAVLTLPAGSELLSDMESIDGALASRQLVLINPHGLRTNLERLSASLADRGLRPDGRPLAASDDALAQAFSGAAGEAQLVLVRRDGTTSAVLTLRSRQP